MKSQLANSNLAEYSYYPTIMSELGFSSINPSGCPRFPAYSVGHSSFSAQQNPNGFGPRVPWGPSMGFPRGPPPQFPLRYGQVIPIRGEQVYNPASGESVINDDPRAEIKILHQQLAQAQEKQVTLDSQVSNLWGLVHKQQREFDSEILKFQTREKEQYQANIERQKVWEEERKREQAKWNAREKAWKERSQRELQEREWGWAKELEKKKREWEREQKWEWETRSKNRVPNGGPKIPHNLGQHPRQMGYQYPNQNPEWNNQMGCPSPRGRQPSQRGRGGNLGNTPQEGHVRVNDDRNQAYAYKNQYIPVREPKLSKYDGRIPWRVYEVKLLHLAKRYQWDDDTKLAKLVEALEDKALTFFSNLPSNVQVNFELVRKKMNNRFLPQEPAITIRKQLQTIHQNTEEALEEWAERCQQCAYDAWGKISPEVAEQAAIEAFLGGVIEAEAAFTVLENDPQTVDEALEFLKKAVHSRKALCCKFRNTQRKVRTVSMAPDPMTAEVRTTGATSSLTQQDSIQKFGAELQGLWSSLAETRKQLAKIVELLSQ